MKCIQVIYCCAVIHLFHRWGIKCGILRSMYPTHPMCFLPYFQNKFAVPDSVTSCHMLCFQGGNRKHLERTLIKPTLPLSITLNYIPYLQPVSKLSPSSGSHRVQKAGTDCVLLQPHRSIVTHSNFQPLWPKRGIIPLFCLSDVTPIDEQRSHVLTHHTWKKFLAVCSPRGSSPFGNVKWKPGELEHPAVERMNPSATINHLSLDAFYPRACNNNSISVTVSSRDVYFVFKQALI